VTTATRPIVLSVDDEASIREAIRLELEDDLDVLTAASGGEALDLLARRHVDVMLLDLRMPQMTGEEVLKKLRAARSQLPVIVTTVVDRVRTVVECMRLGAADYVTKPWEHGEIIRTIQRILREVDAPPGVLLVSDDAAALVPVALALEGRIRVRAMSVAAASVSNFPPQVVVLHAPDRSKVSALSDLSARFHHATTVWVRDESPKHIDKTLSDISAHLGRHAVPRLSRVVLAAVELMVRYCRDPLSLDEIARTVGVSNDHLIRVFREAFGLTAGAYYVRLRIAVACRLLRDTDEKMDDIAQQVGYSGAANLSRAFKEVMGMRPGEFRRSSV
jgi:YesN/AraC family two-component response regulator